jgi:hypothetical protein
MAKQLQYLIIVVKRKYSLDEAEVLYPVDEGVSDRLSVPT